MKNLLQQIGQLFSKKEQNSVSFQVLFEDFKKILELNNQILDLIADANDKLSGEYIFDEHYVHTNCRRLTDLVQQLIVSINQLTGQKYSDLFTSFHQIEADIQAILQGELLSPTSFYTMPYSAINRDMVEAVGGKNAHLAEVGSVLHFPTPEGFAITTTAFMAFWEYNRLDEAVVPLLQAWQQGDMALQDAAADIQEAIFQAVIPKDLEEDILKAAGILTAKQKSNNPCFAIRSSALGEDGSASFAGQYQSSLGVPLAGIVNAYKEVVASLYSPEAMEYRLGKDYRPREIMMAVACQLMVPAKASGVLYSFDPVRPESETMIISSAWGLGGPIVSGEVPADNFVLDRKAPHNVLEMQIVRKDKAMVQQDCKSLNTARVDEGQRMKPSLTTEQLQQLAEVGIQLESYFKAPQDVEFALGEDDQLVLLQSRQLQLHHQQVPRACDLTDISSRHPVLMRGKGVAAMEGVASGPVWFFSQDRDLAEFPMGAILVARYASPSLARVIHKAGGIITDMGATTGHLATVAREYRVPALFNTGYASRVLKNDQEVTMDIDCLTIYSGVVQELQHYSLNSDPIEEMYEYRLLRRVLKKIEPLNLLDPKADSFVPMNCRTYHDLTRFIHEKAVETIIEMGFYHTHHRDTLAGKLLWDIPLDLMLIDVGGGIQAEYQGGIPADQICSVPMRELMRGMSLPGVWDMSPAKVDVGSFMASLTRTAPTHTSSPEDVGRNLAVISAEYTNINFRLGYHFTVIDAYISEDIPDNHIYFRFSGGVTDTTRRARRIRLLGEILSYYDFLCELHGDTVIARLKHMDKKSMLDRLFLLGLLVAFTRQLDVQMTNETKIQFYFQHIKNIMEENNDN